MSNLTVIQTNNGINAIDSREVAEMIDKQHSNLMRDIRGYKEVLDQNSNLNSAKFFIESKYTAETGQSYPCYLLTRKGCDMVANKMTGEKGILFTAEYVTKFEEMENQLKPTCIEDVLIKSLQEMKDVKLKLEQQEQALTDTNNRIDTIKEVVALDHTAWRKETQNMLNKIAIKLGGTGQFFQQLKAESYDLLNRRMRINLKQRLANKQQRMALEGARKTAINNLNYLDIIDEDVKAKEIYLAIVKEMAIKYGIAD